MEAWTLEELDCGLELSLSRKSVIRVEMKSFVIRVVLRLKSELS